MKNKPKTERAARYGLTAPLGHTFGEVSILKATLERLEALRVRLGLSKSQVIQKALDEYINRPE